MKKDIKIKAKKRINIIKGQLEGVGKMIEEEKYCIDIINQVSAIRSALSSVEDLILENHLSTHVIDQIKKGEHKLAKDEILSVYKLSKKK